jgi:hypothetical protein
LGPLAGVERRFKERECVPFSGEPSGAGLSHAAMVTDAHHHKSESEERVEREGLGGGLRWGRRTVC